MGPSSPGLIGFPMARYTLELDFPASPVNLALLDRFDAITVDHGGRGYLAKDARMAPAIIQGHPGLPMFREMRRRYGLDTRFSSLLSQRLSHKAGLTAFLSGLRNAHAKGSLHVMTVKPGFVATQMTAQMTLPPALTAQPAQVADIIVAAHEKRRDVIYVLGRWRLVMTVIRLIPERLFKRLTL